MSFSIIGAFVSRLLSGSYSLPIPGGIWACSAPVSQASLLPQAIVQYPKTDFLWIFESDFKESPRLVLKVFGNQVSPVEILAREMISHVLDRDLVLPSSEATFQIFPLDFSIQEDRIRSFGANRVFCAEVPISVQVVRIDQRL